MAVLLGSTALLTPLLRQVDVEPGGAVAHPLLAMVALQLAPPAHAQSDTTAPSLSSSAGSDTTLTLTYDETLDSNSVPAVTAFGVKVNNTAVSLSTTNPVAISGMAVTLTLANAVGIGKTVTVTYTVPTGNPIQDSAGNAAGGFTNQRVTVTGICDRTEAVRNAIVAAVSGITNCADITSSHLSGITNTLAIRNQRLGSLQPNDFDGLSNLRWLQLDFNSLSSLDTDIFDGLSYLGELYLNNNSLSSLDGDIFDGLSNLTGLFLNNNSLSSLDTDIFDDLSNLRWLYLNNNPLSSLDGDIFAGPSFLQRLLLSNNSLSSLDGDIFADLSSLERLQLENNSLSSLEVGIFADLSSLEWLRLENNSLSSLDGDIFDGLSSLQMLFLWNNLLSSLPEGLLSDSGSLVDLALTGNRLVCLPRNLANRTSIIRPIEFRNLPDCYGVSLAVNPTEVAEGSGGQAITVTASLTAGTRIKSAATAVTISVDSGTATEGTDFNAVSDFTITIASGSDSNTGTFTLTALSDEIAEAAGETVKVTGTTSLSSSLVKGTDVTEAMVTIVSEATAPSLSSAAGSDTTLTLTYDETLDSNSVPAATAFGVNVNDTAVSLSATNPVAISGRAVTLTLANAVGIGKTVTVTYTVPTGNPIQDSAGNAAAALMDQSVTVTGICDRTPAVQTAILATVEGITSCADITSSHLSGMTAGLNLEEKNLSSLQPNDFDGLSNLQELYLYKNSLSSLDGDIFDGLSSLKWLYLYDNSLSSLDGDIFDGLSSLERLYLYDNSLSSLDGDIFDGLSSLQRLRLYKNSLSSLDTDTFDGLSSLERLYLNNSSLSSLDTDIFDDLSNLKWLYLYKNSLSSLDMDIFDGLSSLQTLRLEDNRLSSLDGDIFDGLSNLQNLYLYNNPLRSLPEGLLSDSASLTNLRLAGTPLVCLPRDLASRSNIIVPPTNLPDCYGVSLAVNPTEMSEGSGGQTITVTASLTAGTRIKSEATAVTISVDSGTATEGTDFNAVSDFTITIASGSDSQTGTFTLTALSDGIAEAVDETVKVTGTTSLSSSLVKGTEVTEAVVIILSEATAPSLSSAAGSDTTLTLTYDETLDTNSVPAATAFGVNVNNTAVSLSPTNPVAISGMAVTLTLANAVGIGKTVTVSYTVPTDNPIQDHAGNDAGGFMDQRVTVTGICDRTPAVQTAIVEKLSGITDCKDITPSHLSGMTVLSLNDQSLSSLQADDFDGLSNLQWLFLQNNSLSSLDGDIFEGLSNLQRLRLNDNHLSSLDGDIFEGLSNLQRLWLYDNRLSSLDGDIFEGLSNLQRLQLNRNRLSSLDGDIVEGLSNLQYFFLQDNSLSSLDGDIFEDLSNLQYLYLQDNSLSSLDGDIFEGLSNLQYLYLQDNSLSSLDGDIFEGLSELWWLYLYNNSLRNLPENLFNDSISSLRILSLGGNHFVCLPRNLAGRSSIIYPDSVRTLPDCYGVSLAVNPTEVVEGSRGQAITVTASLMAGTRIKYEATAVTISVDSDTATEGTDFNAVSDFTITIASGRDSQTGTFTLTALSDGIAEAVDETVKVTGTTSLSSSSVTGTEVTKAMVTISDDTTAPPLSSAVGSDTTLTLTYDKTLDSNSVPAATAFGVKVNDTAVSLSTTNPVAISGRAVTLTLANAVGIGKTVTVNYTMPTGNPIQDNAGNAAATFIDQSVTVTGICDRTAAVRNAIVSVVAGITHCKDITPSHLSGMRAGLNVSAKNLGSLQANDFKGLSNLQWLRLDDNRLSSLDVDIFDGLSNLQTLWLYDNSLSSLDTDIFDGLSNLQTLYFKDNSLSSLDVDIFEGLSNLQTLYLQNNSLSSLDVDIFDGPSNLQWLFLQNNSLSSLDVDIFDGLSNLQYLYLSRNSLSSLDVDIFEGLSNFQHLYLDGNSLRSLPEGLFSDSISSLQALSLGGNRLVCLPRDLAGRSSIITPESVRALPDCYGVSLAVNPTEVVEGSGGQAITVTASLTAGTRIKAEAIAVTISVDSGTATEGTDFNAVSDFTITIASGSDSQTGTFTLTALSDTIAEAISETVKVTGTTSLSSSLVKGTEVTEAIVAIQEIKAVSVAPVSTEVTEGTDASFRFSRTGPTTDSLTVQVDVDGHEKIMSSATRAFKDGTGTTVTFVSGSSEAILNLTTEADSTHEGNGEITVTIASSTTYSININNRDATILVRDDEIPTVTLKWLSPGRTGNNPDIRIENNVWVGSIIEGEDISFQIECTGNTLAPVPTGNEGPPATLKALSEIYNHRIPFRFEALLNHPIHNYYNALIHSRGPCLNDKAVTFPQPDQGYATGRRRWTGPDNGLLKLDILEQILDYHTLPGNVANDINLNYCYGTDITILRGLMPPDDIRFCPQFRLGAVTSARIEVTNRNPVITVEAMQDRVAPGNPARFKLTRIWTSDWLAALLDASTVFEYTTPHEGGYVSNPPSGMSTFASGQTELIIEVPTTATSSEPGTNKGKVTLRIGDGSPDAQAQNTAGRYEVYDFIPGVTPEGGNSREATVIISDPAVMLSVDPNSVAENAEATTVTVTATLEEARTEATLVTVSVGAEEDSATEGTDYATVVDLSISIPSGQTSATTTFTLTPTNDSVAEGSEIISLNGSTTVTGLIIDTPTIITLTDDDTARVVINSKTLIINEGESDTYTVKLNTQPRGNVTITPSSDDAGAATVSPATLNFTTSNWNTVQTITVTGVEDDDGIIIAVAGVEDYGKPGKFAPGGLGLLRSLVPTGLLNSAGDPYQRFSEVTYDTDDTGNETVAISHRVRGYGSVTTASNVTVTVNDNDTAGVTVDPTILSMSEGGSSAYTVKLNTMPTRNVTITLSSGDTGAATASPATLTFAPYNWSTAQTVTVTGMDDDDAVDETVTISHGVSGYGSVSSASDVTVTVNDEDTAGVTVDPTTLSMNEGESDTYTVKLNTQPTGNVTITPSSGDADAATASPATLAFTTSNWNTAQTVTVTGLEDDDAVDETVVLSHGVSGYGSVTTASDVTVTVNDNDTAGVTVDPPTLSMSEGESGTYTVKLNTQPTGNVTITPSSGDAGAATASPATLNFTPSNWDTAQTVTVTGVDDDDDIDETVVLSHGVSGYGSVTAASDVTVTVNDNDTAGVTVDPPTLSMSEGGGGTYTVKLNTLPTGNVTITPSSGDAAAATVSPATLTFTPSNWNTAQTVTVTGVEDNDIVNETVTVSHGVSGYGSVTTASDVTVTVNDNDTAGVSVDPTTLSMSEGGSGTYTVKLNTLPTGNVTIMPSSDDAGAATVSHATLTFTTSNWNTAQTVTVTGVVDDDAVNETVTVSHGVSGYGSVSSASGVTVTVNDEDTDEVTVDPTTLSMSEDGRGTYTVKLNTQPTGNVTITPSSDDAGAATVSPATLTFTTSNWDTAQTVTVTGVVDDDAVNEMVTVSHGVSGYGSVSSASDVTVTVNDNDTAGVSVDPTTLSMSEGGSGAYTVKLNTQPTENATITPSSGDADAATASPATLTFTTSNWNTAQTVTVTGVEDDDAVNETVTLSHGVSGYGSVSSASDVTVTVNDNDTAGVTVDPTTLSMSEGGGGTYTVKLNTLPTGNVTITPSSGDADAATVSPATLTFTTSNWNTAQTVTVTGVEDDDTVNETVTVSHGVSGYGSVSSASDVTVTVNDNDTAGVSVDPTTLSMSEGGSGAYTVKLNTQPTGNVTIMPSSGDAGAATVSHATLTFTTSNWNTAQTVTVTGVEDDDAVNETVTVSHGVSGYGSVSSADAVTVTINDNASDVTVNNNDTDGVTVGPTTLSMNEGLTDTYTVKLNTLPTGNVTITPSSGDTGAATASPATLTFTPSNWNTAQTITVTGVEDGDTVDETVTVSHGVSGYGSVTTASDVTVTVYDNDTAGVTVDPTTLSVHEGLTETYTVKLDTQPMENVTITPSSGDEAVATVSPATLTFTPSNWNTAQTVTVTGLADDDTVDETVTVSHGVSGYGSVTTARDVTVTVNDDGGFTGKEVLKGWLPRFGRSVAQQVLDRVNHRLQHLPQPGLEVSVAGEQLSNRGPWEEEQGIMAKLLGFETISEGQLVEGTEFAFSPHQQQEHGDGNGLSFWGGGDLSSFSGQQSDISLSGDVTTALVGANWHRQRWQAGATLTHSWGRGGYEERSSNNEGRLNANLTGLFPYGRYALNDHLSIWGVAGHSWGHFTLSPERYEQQSTDIRMTMGALGLDGLLLDGGGDGVTIRSSADALLLGVSLEENQSLAGVQGEVSRLRVGLEAERPFPISRNGAVLTPSLELGLRQDGGDAETGVGVDMAAALFWSDPPRGIEVELRGRTMVIHGDQAFHDQGLGISLDWDPNPSSSLGPSLSLSQSMGASATSGSDTLLESTPWPELTTSGSAVEGQQQFAARMGYGFLVYKDALLITPEVGVNISSDDGATSLGFSLSPYSQQGYGDSWEVVLERQQHISGNGDNPTTQHSLDLRFSLLF